MTAAETEPAQLSADDLSDSPGLDDPNTKLAPPSDTPGVGDRIGGIARGAATSSGERRESELTRRLRDTCSVTRCNVLATSSPKGGVGKTTIGFVLASLLAAEARLRVIAVDANRDFGTLGALVGDARRSERSVSDLLGDAHTISSAASLLPYVSPLSTGLHVLGGPSDPEAMSRLDPSEYARLLELLRGYYDVILLDLGAGVVDPISQLAFERSDQVVLVCTPEFVTAGSALAAARHVGAAADGPSAIVAVINRAGSAGTDDAAIDGAFAGADEVAASVAIPESPALALMLDSGTFALGALPRPLRLAIRELGATVAERLV